MLNNPLLFNALIVLFISALGGFINHWRGGGWFKKHVFASELGKTVNWALVAILFGFVGVGVWDWRLALIEVPHMWIGSALGWGSYIGATLGNKAVARGDMPRIDKAISGLIHRPVLWGVAGLTLRGLVWSALITAPLMYAQLYGYVDFGWRLLPIALIGSLMGIIYLGTDRFMKLIKGPGNWWGVCEIVWGVVFCGLIGTFLIM